MWKMIFQSVTQAAESEEKIRVLCSRTFDLLFFHHLSHCIFLLSISHNDIPVLAVQDVCLLNLDWWLEISSHESPVGQ